MMNSRWFQLVASLIAMVMIANARGGASAVEADLKVGPYVRAALKAQLVTAQST